MGINSRMTLDVSHSLRRCYFFYVAVFFLQWSHCDAKPIIAFWTFKQKQNCFKIIQQEEKNICFSNENAINKVSRLATKYFHSWRINHKLIVPFCSHIASYFFSLLKIRSLASDFFLVVFFKNTHLNLFSQGIQCDFLYSMENYEFNWKCSCSFNVRNSHTQNRIRFTWSFQSIHLIL